MAWFLDRPDRLADGFRIGCCCCCLLLFIYFSIGCKYPYRTDVAVKRKSERRGYGCRSSKCWSLKRFKIRKSRHKSQYWYLYYYKDYNNLKKSSGPGASGKSLKLLFMVLKREKKKRRSFTRRRQHPETCSHVTQSISSLMGGWAEPENREGRGCCSTMDSGSGVVVLCVRNDHFPPDLLAFAKPEQKT